MNTEQVQQAEKKKRAGGEKKKRQYLSPKGRLNNQYWSIEREVRERRFCLWRLWMFVEEVEVFREAGKCLPKWANEKRYKQLVAVRKRRITKLLGDLKGLGSVGYKLPKWAIDMVPETAKRKRTVVES